MAIDTATNLDYLFPFLRQRIGDTDDSAYRYTDAWIRTALVSGVQILEKWWNFKYLLDSNYNIYRNPNKTFIFDQATYGIIEPGDDQIIILMAAIIILTGSLENSAWDFYSWRDAEISFSNLEKSRAKSDVLTRFWDELNALIKPPQKRLAQALKRSLPGYKDNKYEVGP